MAQQLTPDDEAAADSPGLTDAEDRELRQLTWFAKAGALSDRSRSRISELQDKDRRAGVRGPRPDPSSPHEDRPASRLAPLEPEPAPGVRCPNCGSFLPPAR